MLLMIYERWRGRTDR